MKKLITCLCTILLLHVGVVAQEIIELAPSDSMSITGKGVGQDAAINPFMREGSIAVVENIGKNEFSVRIQYQGKIKKQFTLMPSKTNNFLLPKGYELYFDATLATKASVSFKKMAH